MTPHTSRALSKGQRILRQLLLPHSAAVIGTSQAACDYFAGQGITDVKIFLAPQTLDVEWFRTESQKVHTEHPPTILYVGFLNERKGVKYLLDAFRLLQENLPEARLLIVGDGEKRAELEAESADINVNFSGFIEREKLPQIYAQADVFVLPSLEDTFGVVAAEALACGLSLIVSAYAGISSHLCDAENTFIVEPTDIRNLESKMALLLRDANLRERFRKNSQDFLRQVSPDYSATIFENAINSALKKD